MITWLTGPEALSAAIRRGVAAGSFRHQYLFYMRRCRDASTIPASRPIQLNPSGSIEYGSTEALV